jgi:LysR family transcriptional regulator, low CO2-responsive transcriptional regulator
MTPEQLLTFATVAEYGNISHAANALYLSQPAVSGQLRLLQEGLGESLYQREGRGIRLTDAGRKLAVHAERLRASYREALAFQEALSSLETGTLRIGASTTPASYLLPYRIAEFHRRYPDIVLSTIDGNTTEIVSGLGSLDIAFIEGAVPDGLAATVGVHPWHHDEIVAVVPSAHPLAARPQGHATLHELADFPMIWREPGSGVRQTVEQAFERAGVTVRVSLELTGVEGVKEAVRAGMGIGFVSAMAMRHEDAALASLRIVTEPDEPRQPAGLTRSITILVPHEATPSRVTRAFLDICLASNPSSASAVATQVLSQ